MSGYECKQSLFCLTDKVLGAMVGIAELQQKLERDVDLDDELLAITMELVSWGLNSEAEFLQGAPFVPELCRQILYERYGERWQLRRGLTVQVVYSAFYPEFENLRKVLLRQEDADLERAKLFCMALNTVGLQQWRPERRWLAAV